MSGEEIDAGSRTGGPMKDEWRLIGTAELLADYPVQWDRLNEMIHAGHPFSDRRFVFPLLQRFAGDDVRVAVLGEPARPRALLVLQPYRAGLWRSLQRSQAQVSPQLMAAADLPALGALFGALPGTVLAIDFLCQDPYFSALLVAPDAVSRRYERHSLTASIDLRGHFEAYWQARPRGLRQTIARSFKRAEAKGTPLRLVTVEAPDRIEDAVHRFGRLESRGWKGAEGTAVSPENAQGLFYAEVFRAFAETRQAISYELYAGDKMIAQQLALASGTMCITLKTTYDERHRELAPGRVLDYEMLRLEFARRRFDRIELYTDADEAQLRWTTGDRWVEHVTCFRSPLVGTAYTVARACTEGFRGWKERAALRSRTG